MDTAGHVAVGKAFGTEVLCPPQGRFGRRGQGAEVLDVAPQPQDKVFHIGGALGHGRVLAQHQQNCLRSSGPLVPPQFRLVEGASSPRAVAGT